MPEDNIIKEENKKIEDVKVKEINKLKARLEKLSQEELQELAAQKYDKRNGFLYVFSCCSTSVPSEFNINFGWADTAAVSCLHCQCEEGEVTATCGSDGVECAIPACLTKIVGCINYVVSTEVRGDYFWPSCESNLCCSSSVCVDQCVKCEPLPCECPLENGEVHIVTAFTLATQSPYICPNTVTFFSVFLIPLDACNNPCIKA